MNRQNLALWLIGLGVFALLTLWAGNTALWDRDEPRFARAAVEMMGSGDFIVPTFNGKLRADKPPLLYWLMQTPLRVLGTSELAVRLPSAVCMALCVVLTGWCGRKLFDQAVGLWSAGMMGTCVMSLWIGSAATADATLLLGMMLTFAVITSRIVDGPTWWSIVILIVGQAWAWLAKGPVAALPLGCYLVWILWRARTLRDELGIQSPAAVGTACGIDGFCWKRESSILIIGLCAGLIALVAWGWPANERTGGALLSIGIGKHVIERMVKPAEGHGGEGILGYLALLPIYVPLLIAGFFPWTLMLPGAISALLRGSLTSPSSTIAEAPATMMRSRRAWLLCWIAVVFIVMSLVSTKLPHYILPMYPALAILSAAVLVQRRAGGVDAASTGLREKDRDWLRGGVWFMGVVGVALALGTVGAAYVLSEGQAWWRGAAVCIAALVVISVACRHQLAERHGGEAVHRAARVVIVGFLACVLLALFLLMPVIERGLKPAAAITEALRSIDVHNGDVSSSGFNEPTLVFYLNRAWDRPLPQAVPVEQWVAQPGSAYLITTAELWHAQTPIEADRFQILKRVSVVNYADEAHQSDVLVVQRAR